MYTLRNIFDDDFFMTTHRGCLPRSQVSVKKTDVGIALELEVPGASEEDISVEVGNSVLVIEGKVRERKISHRYSLPDGSDPQNVVASVENGLLKVEIPNGAMRKVL